MSNAVELQHYLETEQVWIYLTQYSQTNQEFKPRLYSSNPDFIEIASNVRLSRDPYNVFRYNYQDYRWATSPTKIESTPIKVTTKPIRDNHRIPSTTVFEVEYKRFYIKRDIEYFIGDSSREQSIQVRLDNADEIFVSVSQEAHLEIRHFTFDEFFTIVQNAIRAAKTEELGKFGGLIS